MYIHNLLIALTVCFSISFGAGIVVESLSVPNLFSRLLYNPLCTLLLGDPTSPPNKDSDINVCQD